MSSRSTSPNPTETSAEAPEELVTVQISEADAATDDVVEACGRLAQRLPRCDRPATPEEVQQIVDSPATRLLLARDETGRIVGMLTVAHYQVPSGTRVWFEDTAVASRGRGIGRQLVEEALRIARTTGATDAEIIVHPSQAGGLRRAAAMGFGTDDEDTRRIMLR